MKILQISSTPVTYEGGTERVVWEISKRLAKKHKVTVLQTDLYAQKHKKGVSYKDNVKIITFKNDLYLGGYGFAGKAIKWLKENWKDYDVVHSHGYNRFLSEFSVFMLKKKIPIVFTPHGFMHTKKNYVFKIIHNKTFGRFIQKADICTALTKLDFKDYGKLGVKKEKIVEIPNGVDIKKFQKVTKREVASFKKKYGLSKTILFVGRIHESKGLQYVTEAIKSIDCKLLIIGEDAGYKKELEKKIKSLGIGHKVIFAGNIGDEEKIKAYHACEALVLYSEWEGFGITVIEAMASGKPVIVSDKGSLPFLVNNKKEGFVVKFKDITDLRKRIELILTNKEESKRMGEEGKKKAKKYEWNKIVGMYLKTYKEVLKKNDK